ncbi:MAG: KpsF/GutQ family sugar-phosphate isomerase [Flavobacteriales bacterium]
MKKKIDIIESAVRTIRLEAQTIADLEKVVDQRFEAVVKLVLKSKGRLVVTGIGKSANIAQKLVATFNSTGQPAVFMHAADAIHGDLGNVQKGDAVLCISKSGDSPEIKVLVPLLKSMGNALIGMYSNANGFLAQHSDYHLLTPIEKEACPNNLAPTSSTTAQLAMGDALAVALMEQRGFSSKDFAKYHPGGALGKKLYTKVSDLLQTNSKLEVAPGTSVKEVIIAISAGRVGAVAVIEKGALKGIVTDGDVRRMLEKDANIHKLKAKDIMGVSPKTIDASALAVEAFQLMENHNISQVVVTKSSKYKGIVHLHDILKEGIF